MSKTITYTAKRPAADILELIRPAAAKGDYEACVKLATQYRGGSIWPFESDVVYAIRDAKDIGEVQALLASIENHEYYTWTFQPGQAVVYVLEGEKAEKGRVHGAIYVVEGCFIGEHWSGPTEWVHLKEFPGSGYDPDAFMDASDYNAIQAARNGDGKLVRASHDGDLWMSPKNQEIGDRCIPSARASSLIERGVFRSQGAGALQSLWLNEGHWLVKKAGLRLPLEQRVTTVLARHGIGAAHVPQIINDLGLKEPAN